MTMTRRRLLALVPAVAAAALIVSGCGFRPLYGRHADAPGLAAELATVEVAPIEDRTGQLLRNALEQRLERAGSRDKVYTLIIEAEDSRDSLGLSREATVSRANFVLSATYRLYRDGRVVWTGASRSAAAYNVLSQQFATVMAERDSRDRAVTQVADDIIRRLAVFLGNRPDL